MSDTINSTTPTTNASRTGIHNNVILPPRHLSDEDEGDNQMELLMRHSSPFTREGAAGVTSPSTAERNSSPSTLRLTRPRSNPRNRTPMRYQSPLTDNAFRIPEEGPATTGGITIRPTAGRAVGTALGPRAAFRHTTAEDDRRTVTPGMKSQKQGPSHRKVRRWNNDNFVNLAAEINSGNKGGRAARALMMGHSNADQYRAIICDPEDHTSKAMTRLREEESLKDVREKFFEGELGAKPAPATRSSRSTLEPTTPEEMLLRIEARLRRVVIKACENSVPASTVVEHVEAFLLRAHRGKKWTDDEEDWWKELLVEPPSVTHRKRDDSYITRFLFDGDSPNGGFHRLLLHGLCQFHGLRATSSSMEVTIDKADGTRGPVQARLLMATGTVAEAFKKVKLVEYIMLRKELKESSSNGFVAVPIEKKQDDTTNALQALKV